jgi:uncharacterized protein YggE
MMRVKKIVPILLVLAGFAGVTSAQSIQVNRDNKTITINTSDEATAIADIAAVTIGFQIYGSDSQGTYADGGKLSHAIMDAMRKLGIKDENIESAGQGLEHNSNFDDKTLADERAKKQFMFHQSWTISVPPVNSAKVIRVAIAAGANESGGIEWRFADRKSLQAKAAANALVKARAVAEEMAEGLHVKLGALIYASNEMPRVAMFRRMGVMNTESASVASSSPSVAAAPLEIRPQTIREEATVYAVFAIE